MKKTLALILLLSTVFCLSACSGGEALPEGMQLARGTDEIGYYFYVPEEWIVSNLGEISAAYASKVDSSSASYVETEAPSVSGDETVPLSDRRKLAARIYFYESISSFKTAPTVVIDGEAVTFGNAELAIKYVYNSEYQEHKFRTMQILVYFANRFGIFTFNSPNEKMTSDEVSQFDYYSEKVQKILDNFKFVTKSTGEVTPDERAGDEDGYLLSSDKTKAGLSVYLPPEFTLDYSSGIIGAHLPDGSALTVSRATSTNVTVNDYWEYRKDELEALFGNVTLIESDAKKGEGEEEIDGERIELEGAKFAFAYEYTYEFSGETYHVYQVLATTNLNGFVFTYTAKEANFKTHLDTVKIILSKVEF